LSESRYRGAGDGRSPLKILVELSSQKTTRLNMRLTLGVTDGLKPDGQTTLVGEEGDINKTSSPPHDLKKLEKS
jgi:hypothetical protein